MQALVLTHELTKERDFDTYLPRRLAPLRPLLSYGRSAKAYPQADASHCVFSWWKDFQICILFAVEPTATPMQMRKMIALKDAIECLFGSITLSPPPC